MFIPYTIAGVFERGILVKTTGAPLALVNSLRHEIWEVDRHVAVTMTGSLVRRHAERSRDPRRRRGDDRDCFFDRVLPARPARDRGRPDGGAAPQVAADFLVTAGHAVVQTRDQRLLAGFAGIK